MSKVLFSICDYGPQNQGHLCKLRFKHHLKAEQTSCPLMFGLLGYDNIWLRYNYANLVFEGAKKTNIEKITMSLAMHITNQNKNVDIFTVGNLQNIFMEHDLYLIH